VWVIKAPSSPTASVNFHLDEYSADVPASASDNMTPITAFRHLNFEEVPEEINETTLPPLPDTGHIRALTNELYPVMVARHAPYPGSRMSCSRKNCHTTSPLYSCSDCFHQIWYCKDCILEAHINNPFHHIQEWNEVYHCRVVSGTKPAG
jgi:hypothetical protein